MSLISAVAGSIARLGGEVAITAGGAGQITVSSCGRFI